MKQTKKQIALYLAVGVNLVLSLNTGAVFANSGELDKENADYTEMVCGSLAYDYDPITVEDFAKWANLSLEQAGEKAEVEPYLLQRYEIESVGGFNPYTCESCDVRTLDELEDGRFTDDQAWKWFKYRREEIGACFEDETFNEAMQKCELLEDLSHYGGHNEIKKLLF